MLDPPPVDGSTMIVKKPSGGAKPNGTNQNVSMEQGRQELMKNLTKKKLWCSYRKKACHTKEKCGKLHGKPQGLNRGDGMRSLYFLHHNYFFLFNIKYIFWPLVSFYLIKIAKAETKTTSKRCVALRSQRVKAIENTLIQNLRESSTDLNGGRWLSAAHTTTSSRSVQAIGLALGFNSLIKNSLNAYI